MINNPFHPGVFLQEVLDEQNISAYRLAKDTHMPATRISEILKKRSGKVKSKSDKLIDARRTS